MTVFGPYTSAAALMEATQDPFSLDAGDPFTKRDWTPFDTIETHKSTDYWTGRVRKNQKNFMATLVPSFFLKDFSDSEVYVQVMPNSEMPQPVASQFRKAHSREKTQQLVEKAMAKGYPPRRFRVYLVGPGPATFNRIVPDADIAARKDERGTFDSKIRGTVSRQKEVLGWVDYTIHFFKDNYSAVDYRIERTGWYVLHPIGTPDVVHGLSTNELDKLGEGIHANNPEAQAVGLVHHYYLYGAWSMFRKFLDDRSHGPSISIERALGRAKTEYHKAKEISTSDLPPAHDKGVGGPSKVIPSIMSDGGEAPFDVVSAEPHDRMMISRTDGTMKRVNPKIDQRELLSIPAAPVRPIISTSDYKAVFGIHYEHPIIKPGLNKQTWWYTDREQLVGAAQTYAELTGDRPSIVFRMSERTGPNAGLYVSHRVLKSRSDSATRNFLQEINQLVTRFQNKAAEGQRRFPAFMLKHFDFDVKAAMQKHPDRASGIDTPQNPTRQTPSGFSKEMYNKYVTWVREEFANKLGLYLKASERGKLLYTRDAINKELRKKAKEKFRGEKKEKWGLYIIQYLLAHSPSETSASYTYMIPLNIIRSARVDIEERALTSVKETDLKTWLRENHGEFTYFKQTQDWSFIRSQPTMPFPFARLIRPMIMLDNKKIAQINQRLPKHVQMTRTGYLLDGVEFDAFTMVVAMPPSVADEEFGLVSTNKMARQIISDPNMVYRLRKTKRGKRGSVAKLNLFSIPTSFMGAGVAHPDDPDKREANTRAREKLAGFDPQARGVIPYSNPTPEAFATELGRKYAPIIKQHVDGTGNLIRIGLAGFEKAGSKQQRLAKWDEFIQNTEREAKDTELLIHQVMGQLAAAVRTKVRGPLADDLHQNIQQYIRFVKMEVGSKGRSIRIPQVVSELGLSEYHAIIGSTNYKNVFLRIKAPSPDIAKLLILYRLLRRSLDNKQTGRLMAIRMNNRGPRVFPEIHAMILAQWAAAKFPVVMDEPVRTRTIFKEPKIHKTEWASHRSKRLGAHSVARMLRVD